MPSWKKIIQSGSDAHLSKITASELRISSIKFDDGGTIASSTDGAGFKLTGSVNATTSDLEITGTLKVNTEDTSNTAIFTNNIQNGYPTSNNWGENLEGSFFNNFSNTTHVSEILRFMAGVLSSSLDVADAQPNTRTLGNVSRTDNSAGTQDMSALGFVPQTFNTNNSVLRYLNHTGFVTIGEKLFNGETVNNNPVFNFTFTSVAVGDTTISSTADTQLFGLGRLTDNPFKVRLASTQSFSSHSDITTPTDSTSNHTTSSEKIFSTSDFGTTSDGLTLAKIETSQPAVIPAAFQDGKFTTVGGANAFGLTSLKPFTGDLTNISASGYYNFQNLSVSIASGSSEFSNNALSFLDVFRNKKIFYAPTEVINNDLGTNTITDDGNTLTRVSATSRSLSGAPYIRTAEWKIESKISGLFEPMYDSSTTLVSTEVEGDDFDITPSGDISTVHTNGARINTKVTNGNGIYTQTGLTQRNIGDIPARTDIAKHTSSLQSNWSSGVTNIQQNRTLSDTSFVAKIKGRKRTGTQVELASETIEYHESNTFGVPSASGSLAIFGRDQGANVGTDAIVTNGSTNLENFEDENHRLKITDVLLSGDATNTFDTTFNVANIGGETGVLSDADLQVKPGYLVDPYSANGYWYPNNGGGNTFKYYIKRYRLISGAPQNLNITLKRDSSNIALVNWDSSTEGFAVAVLFNSSVATSETSARLFDPTTSAGLVANYDASSIYNPFNTGFELFGRGGSGGVSNNVYTLGLIGANKMDISLPTNDDFYLLIRLKKEGNVNNDYITQIRVSLT